VINTEDLPAHKSCSDQQRSESKQTKQNKLNLSYCFDIPSKTYAFSFSTTSLKKRKEKKRK
jgi:hypothetical protein